MFNVIELIILLTPTVFLIFAIVGWYVDYSKRGCRHIVSDVISAEKQAKNTGLILSSLWRVNKAILSTLNFESLAQEVVNVILQELDFLKIGYRISVLTVADRKAGIVRRISFSPTPEALEILKKANVKFEEIKIPLSASRNLLVKAIKHKKAYITHDMNDVFYPVGDPETWIKLQQMVGIKTSMVFPLIIRNESIGAMIFSLSKTEKQVSVQEKAVLGGFTDAVAVALENSRLYQKIHEANAKLEELDKRKDEFLSVAAHELRAPLTAVKGYLSMVIEGDAGKVPKKIQEFLQGAFEGAEREVRLVNNMLNMSRIEEGRLVYQIGTVSLFRVLKTVFQDFMMDAKEKGLAFKLKIPQGMRDSVLVDQDRIYEVIANFISNAIKYTDSGSVTVTAAEEKDNNIRVEVSDTGYGMTEEEQKKLFAKFYRAESSAGKKLGTGLGLYITKLLIKKFNGNLGLISQRGKGSTFWFSLPLHKQSRLKKAA